MGIELDWQVEATDGHEQVGEDPAVVSARERRSRRWRRVLIAIGVILTAVGLTAGLRYEQVQRARREMLIATVESEALALRIGDLQAFMRRQGDDEIWQGQQMRLFREFQALSPAVQIPGEILTLRIAGNEAQVTVRELVDGQPTEGAWLYEYTDKGWRHVGSLQEPWSQNHTRVTDGFVFLYKRPSEPLVDALEAVLAQWRSEVIALMGDGDLPTLQVWIEARSDPADWLDSEQRILVIPGNRTGGEPIITLDDPLRARLAEVLAARWAGTLVEGMSNRASDRWLRNEVGMLLRHRLDPDAPPAPVLEPLIRAFGPDLMPELMGLLDEETFADHALPLAMSASAPRGLSDEQLTGYLTYMLEAETGLRGYLSDQYPGETASRRVQAIFTDGSGLHQPGDAIESFLMSFGPGASSWEVQISHRSGDELWAYALGTYEVPAMNGKMIPVEVVGLVPFREVNGYWVRAGALTADDWGAVVEERGERIVLRYHELDRSFVAGSLPDLEATYRQVAADFGLADPPTIQLTVMSEFGQAGPAVDEDTLDLRIVSPLLMPCVGEGIRACTDAQRTLVRYVLSYILDGQSGRHEPDYPRTPMQNAISNWEMERLGIDNYDWYMALMAAGMPLTPPERMEDLWLSYDNRVNPSEPDVWLRDLGVRALLDVLVENYGSEAIPLLFEHLDSSNSLAEWLDSSLGITPDEIEPVWRSRYRIVLTEHALLQSEETRQWYIMPSAIREPDEY